ncbi:MAG: threonine ammonia-lyase, partial [Terriglobales bacterium]
MQALTLADFDQARRHVSAHAYHTPLLTSRILSERTGYEVRLKAEVFQRTGSYKIRGPLNKFQHLTADEKRRGVICSSAGNHAQGVALAAALHKMKAVVCMAENATPSKIEATKAYGAEVVLQGAIWDEADARARALVAEHGYTYIHPFDDPQLIAGQGTVGLEIHDDWPEVDVVVVPIGGGGLISGTSMALKARNPKIRIFGVESSGSPGMQKSVAAGHVVTLDRVDSIIDGLRVKKVGENTCWVVSRFVEQVVTLPDSAMFDAMLWI